MLGIKRLLTWLFFKIVPRVRSPFRSGKTLVIRLDGIGDYVLFRNFLPELKRHRITLLGDVTLRDIAETYDRPYISEFIWIDQRELARPGYLLSVIVKMKIRAFDVAINPTFTSPVHEKLLLYSGAKKRLSAADSTFDHPFEFHRNRAFIETITGKKEHTLLALPVKKSEYIDASQTNIVVFPGAGDASRRWSTTSFASAIIRIKRGNIRFIIAGGNDSIQLASEIKSKINFPIVDLTGKTSLVELIDLIGSCQFLISNETSAVHIAAATGTRAICISNGNHFHRFNPYPRELSDRIITLYPSEKFYSEDQRDINELIEACWIQSDFDINLVTVDSVIEAFQKLSVTSFP